MDLESSKPIRIYPVHQIVLVSLFGTALAGLVAIAINYKALGYKREYVNTIIVGSLVILAYLLVFTNLPSSSYDRIFPILTSVFLGGSGSFLQKNMIESAINNGAIKRSKLSLFLLILFCLISMLFVTAIII